MLVAEESGELCGYLAALIRGDLSFVRWMGVKNKYQGEGIGSKLIKYWEGWAAQKGVRKVRLSTYLEENKGLYEKLGFKLSETQEKSVGIKYRLTKEL